VSFVLYLIELLQLGASQANRAKKTEESLLLFGLAKNKEWCEQSGHPQIPTVDN